MNPFNVNFCQYLANTGKSNSIEKWLFWTFCWIYTAMAVLHPHLGGHGSRSHFSDQLSPALNFPCKFSIKASFASDYYKGTTSGRGMEMNCPELRWLHSSNSVAKWKLKKWVGCKSVTAHYKTTNRVQNFTLCSKLHTVFKITQCVKSYTLCLELHAVSKVTHCE